MVANKQKKSTSPKSEISVEPTNIITNKFFDKFYQEDGRIYLKEPMKFCEIPDLLALQKRGFEEFLNVYIHKLFADISPIWDIA